LKANARSDKGPKESGVFAPNTSSKGSEVADGVTRQSEGKLLGLVQSQERTGSFPCANA